MTPDEYRERSLARSRKNDTDVSHSQARLSLYALGLTGEAGEVADEVKKHIFHGKPLDPDIGVPDPVVLEIPEDRPYLFRTIGEVMLPLELHQLNSSIDRPPGFAPRRCR